MRTLVLIPSSLETINDGTKIRAQATVRALEQFCKVETVIFEGRFYPPPASFSRLKRLFSPMPSLLRRFQSLEFAKLVADRSREVDLCYFVGLQMGLYRSTLPVRIPCVLDNYNVESEILYKLAIQRPWTTRWFWYLEYLKLKRAESAILRTADACVAISQEDAEVLSRMAPKTPILTVPPALDLGPYEKIELSEHSGTLVFIGALDWHVNEDAALWVANQVMPRILKAHPSARLLLVGRNPSAAVRALAGASIEVHADVESVLPFLKRAQIVLAPLRYGSGVQNKVIHGMAASRPVVVTPISATGIPAKPNEHFLIGSDAESYAQACCQLLANPKYGEELGTRARAFALRNYSEQHMAERLPAVIEVAMIQKQKRIRS